MIGALARPLGRAHYLRVKAEPSITVGLGPPAMIAYVELHFPKTRMA